MPLSEPAVPDPSLLQADVNDDVVIVDIEMLLPIELADKRAVVNAGGEPPVETDNTVEVAVTVGDVAATGDAVATQVDQDLDALGTVFTPKAAGEQPIQLSLQERRAIANDHEGVADTSQTAASKAELVLDTALAAGREHVPSMWEPSIRHHAHRTTRRIFCSNRCRQGRYAAGATSQPSRARLLPHAAAIETDCSAARATQPRFGPRRSHRATLGTAAPVRSPRSWR